MLKNQLKHNKLGAMMSLVLVCSVFLVLVPVTATGEGISTNKSTVKANMPIKFTATGLTVSTYYTVYAEDVFKGNKSTSSIGTTLEFKFVVSDDFVSTYVTIDLRTANGSTVLATTEIECVDVIPQYTIDMLGGLIPLIMVFAVIMSVVFGIPQAIVGRLKDL